MYGGGDEEAVGGLEGAEADLDLELGAVLAQSVQVESGAQGSDPLLVGVGVAVFGVVGVEAAGGEEFDGVVSAQPAGLRGGMSLGGPTTLDMSASGDRHDRSWSGSARSQHTRTGGSDVGETPEPTGSHPPTPRP
ncbi:hypothetical protein ACFYOF_31580 [Streptomyces sp. NPDC007148]|uniref:hypothetical protein n=1 Tax=Streptomyces sp. NPDC007148 TaxID=3364775 RepID=UPI0036BEC56A